MGALRVFLSFVFVLAAGLVFFSADAQFADVPRGEIAFTSDRDGNFEIYVMNTEGKHLRRLTDHPATDTDPVWSPDGNWIAFASERNGDSDIYVMDALGTNLRRLTDNPGYDGYPAWSPDGKLLAFASYGKDGKSEIYTMRSDGKQVSRLTNNLFMEIMPSWSPDGRRIAFVSQRSGFEIFLMDDDGGNETQVFTNLNGYNVYPAWSPNGRHIAFTYGGAPFNVYVINTEGQARRKLTTTGGSAPSWSPDGRFITYTSGTNGNADIYVMDADGKNPRNLTNHPSADAQPDWSVVRSVSPAGKWLGAWGVFKADGGQPSLR